jgi:hypothetical protein
LTNKIESRRERLPARVAQRIGEALGIGDPALQHLGDKRLGVNLLAEPIGVERIRQEPVIADKVLDRCRLADIRLIVRGRGFHRGFGGGHRLIPREVLGNGKIGGGRCGHRRERSGSMRR